MNLDAQGLTRLFFSFFFFLFFAVLTSLVLFPCRFSLPRLWFPEHDMQGLPWEVPDNYAQFNPARPDLIAKWSTPMMIIHVKSNTRTHAYAHTRTHTDTYSPLLLHSRCPFSACHVA